MTMPLSQRKLAVLLILDSVGVGAMPDAAAFFDPPNCSTLRNVAAACQGLCLPNLEKLGLGHIVEIAGVPPAILPSAAFGKMAEISPGKDTTTGHWEIAGVQIEQPLTLFPNGFPSEIIEPFIARTGRGILGNKIASGTVIIDELAEIQRQTGKWIVYTSADSVFQIAAHEEWIPLEELYRACEIAREILDPYQVGRIIARPYIGQSGQYSRTPNRKDYALPPPSETILDRLVAADIPVTGVGKISNIFAGMGISQSISTRSNCDGMEKTIQLLREQDQDGLIFVNLVDFDSKYGHRNDPLGYGDALEKFDKQLGLLLPLLSDDNLLIITADHGCDPTTPGTDHTREYVPLLVKHSSLRAGTALGIRKTFADIAQSLATFWDLAPMSLGTSFLPYRQKPFVLEQCRECRSTN
jgi:phosphopentomutase